MRIQEEIIAGVAVILLSLTMSCSPSGSEAECGLFDLYKDGWILINEPMECTDKTITLGEGIHLRISSLGELRLRQSTLEVNGDIEVGTGGSLVLDEAEILIADDPMLAAEGMTSRHRRITVEEGARLELSAQSVIGAENGDGPFSCDPSDEYPIGELKYFEMVVRGSLTMKDSAVEFPGVARSPEGQALWNESRSADAAKAESQILSGIQIHPGARALIENSMVAYGELHGIYIMETFEGVGEDLGDFLDGPDPVQDVVILDSDIHHNGLAVCNHPGLGGDGIVLVDARSIEPCEEEFPPPMEVKATKIFPDYHNPVLLDSPFPMLRKIAMECQEEDPQKDDPDALLQQLICMEELWPKYLELVVEGCTIHHNSRGGMRLQSTYTRPRVIGNDIFENGNDLIDPWDGDAGGADTVGGNLAAREIFSELTYDHECGPFDPDCMAYDPVTYHPEYENDLVDDSFVPYQHALAPSLKNFASYGIYSILMQSGSLEQNSIHHHRGFGVYHSKGGSWLVRENEIYQNGVGFKAGCPASRLPLVGNWFHDNGAGLYVSFSYITGISFWTEIRDNLFQENYLGLFVWNTAGYNVVLRGSNKFVGNEAMGLSFMRASYVYRSGQNNDYVPVDWVFDLRDPDDPDRCSAEGTVYEMGIEGTAIVIEPGVEVLDNDVMIAGQVRLIDGPCPFTLTNAEWTYYQDMPGSRADCDTDALPFIDEEGRDATERLAMEDAGLNSECRSWEPAFCNANDPDCLEDHPAYPPCCNPMDPDCRIENPEYAICPTS